MCLLGENSASWAGSALLHGIYCILQYTELNLQICNQGQKDAFVAKIVNMRLTKTFMVIFALAERLATSAILGHHKLRGHFRYFSTIQASCVIQLNICLLLQLLKSSIKDNLDIARNTIFNLVESGLEQRMLCSTYISVA